MAEDPQKVIGFVAGSAQPLFVGQPIGALVEEGRVELKIMGSAGNLAGDRHLDGPPGMI
jgi:hypothetical protein